MVGYQFSLRVLLLSTAMVAAGIASIAIVDRSEPSSLCAAWIYFGLWLSGGALIGAGVFLLVRRPILGAVIGLLVQVLASVAYSLAVA